MSGRILAQTDTSTPPQKPANTSTSSAAKTKRSTSAHPVAKHTSSSTTAQQSKGSRGKVASRRKGSRNSKTAKKRGQQVIDADRARAIQEALIREHYMDGEPSGKWDAATQAAMQKYQADQGWQVNTTPDSRALIKLGLGPSNDHLLNPESAMTSAPASADPKAPSKPSSAQKNVPQQ